jgi:hypothetical protein
LRECKVYLENRHCEVDLGDWDCEVDLGDWDCEVDLGDWDCEVDLGEWDRWYLYHKGGSSGLVDLPVGVAPIVNSTIDSGVPCPHQVINNVLLLVACSN